MMTPHRAHRVLLLGALAVTACGGAPAAHTPRGASVQAATEPSAAQLARQSELAAQLAPIFAAYPNRGGVLSSDGTQLLYRSDRDGESLLLLADVARPSDAPRYLVRGTEGIASASLTRDGHAALYRQDTAHDESFHILRVSLDGGAPEDLTPGEPLWRDHPFLPADRPQTMVYSARASTDLRTSVYVQALSASAPHRVYTDPAPGAVVDVTADGARALLLREATSGRELVEVDLASGAARRLFPTDGSAPSIKAAAYAADGRPAYVSTDHASDRYTLVALDLATTRELARYTPGATETAISSIVVSPRGDRIAIDVGTGDDSSARLLDATTLAVANDVHTPLGSVSVGLWTEIAIGLNLGAFTADGTHLVIGLSTPEHPADPQRVDASTGALVPLRDEPRAGLASLAPLAVSVEHIPSFDGKVIPLNLYLPPGDHHATVVWLHGGPDQGAEVAWDVMARAFTTEGIAYVEPNIRGSAGFGHAWELADDREHRVDAFRDLATIAAWARAQHWCDGARLVIGGASFGGYYALMALERQHGTWRAGVDVAGVADLHALLTAPSVPRRYLGEFGDPATSPELIRAFDPMRGVDDIAAPLFVYQGIHDTRVPRAHADGLVASLRARGAPVELMLAEHEGHTVSMSDLMPRLIRFVEESTR